MSSCSLSFCCRVFTAVVVPGSRPTITFSPLGTPQKLADGIDFYEVTSTGMPSRKVWIYLPANRSSAKLPCVFIAPAGSPCIAGMSLGEGDQPEHLPYVRAGFAVVAYSLDGELPERMTQSAIVKAVRTFRDVDGGVGNGKAAIDYALSAVPSIDANRLYCAGHSSAATVSLLLAEHEPRIKACIAYAPIFNVTERTDAKLISIVEQDIPDFSQYLTQISPSSNLNKLTCPVFLFHADDDSNVEKSTIDPYATQLQRLNPKAQYVTVPTGEHYDSMLNDGIPQSYRLAAGYEVSVLI